MIVSQVVAAVRAAFSPKHIIFCVVEEVALNYYNVPRILNTLGICVPHQQLDAATKLTSAFGDVFVRTTWAEEPPNGSSDWKRPYPRFEAFIEEDHLNLVIFPETYFHLQPLKHSIVQRSACSKAHTKFSKKFNFSTDLSELSEIPVPRLSSLPQGLLKRVCEARDIYTATCVEQLVDGMTLSEAWCSTNLERSREEELEYVLGVIRTRPQRQNLFLESDAYHRQDDQELMMIPGSDEPLHDQKGTGENSRCRSWTSAFQMACSFALCFIRNIMSHNRLIPQRSWVSLQYVSDLHLESQGAYASFEIPKVAPYLVLAGDIGCLKNYEKYLEFLTVQCQRFWRVFLVLGNHEFYGISRQEGLDAAESLRLESCLGGRLTILYRNKFHLNRRITILGCTLHSHIPSESELWVRMKVVDFSHINNWTVQSHNAEHKRDVEWLRTCVQGVAQANPKSKILMVTHHAPALKNACDPKYLSNPWNSAFCTDVLNSQIPYWIFGLTHWSTQFVYRGITLCSNQRGVLQPKARNEAWLKRLLSCSHRQR